MTRLPHLALTVLSSLFLFACSKSPDGPMVTSEVSSQTAAIQKELANQPVMKQITSINEAKRGLIASPSGQVIGADGDVVWDFEAFTFIDGEAPATVNPLLWRQAQLNNIAGLFKVTDGIYQVRGFDLSNMTLIEGKTGWIVVDTMTSEETARKAMDFVREHLGDRPVTAVVYTHSHVDHFGGAQAVLSRQDAAERKVPVVAPAGFMEEATSENVMVGPAMGRRSTFMYGKNLPRSATGLVGNGLGKAVAYGRIGLLAPTHVVEKAKETITLDGVAFEFYNVPGSEAPSEFVFYLPEKKVFGAAELFSHTLHNMYTLRGAKVRDALKWVNYMQQAMAFAKEAEVMVTQHNWPVWGKENIKTFMTMQRDVYKYIHDQTVHYINKGYTPIEISEAVKLPPALDSFMSTRGFYGTVSHNVKAVYQFYMGWYDANPANLNPIEPVEAAKRYVALAGGLDAMLDTAEEAVEAGDYRWASELLMHAVYAEPESERARELQAVSFEQMGYVAESGPWRNVYLVGAQELRGAAQAKGIDRKKILDLLQATPVERFLESMATALNAERAAGVELTLNLNFTDIGENHVLRVKNSVLTHTASPLDNDAQATLNLTKPFFLKMLIGEAGGLGLLTSSETDIEGSLLDLRAFFGLLDQMDGQFAIVTP